MGEKGLAAMEKLPTGYHIDGGRPGVAKPDGRPGLPIVWDPDKGVWGPPGFVSDPGDPNRAFNQTTGKNAVWDDKAHQWIDAQTGKPIGYEQ